MAPSASWTGSLLLSLTASMMTGGMTYLYFRKRESDIVTEWQLRRQEERTGRIRAEVRLRTARKEQTKSESGGLTLTVIGTVVSPFTKRMGTPRQPQLAPSSRGYIQFSLQAESLMGIDQYSHLWVIFEFHANTNIDNKRTKIRPPRGKGEKVGQLATRSPHRPNALGLSLIKIERWDATTRRLHVSGLDLVNGTPVYDVKPCVPWDVPGFPFSTPDAVLRTPSWVAEEDSLSNVMFDPTAKQQLQFLVLEGRLAPLYTVDNDGESAALRTLTEVLAQDPRSSHKGVNARGSISKDSYSLIFCQCRVEFDVSAEGVVVQTVTSVDFDRRSYVDGVPLISESAG